VGTASTIAFHRHRISHIVVLIAAVLAQTSQDGQALYRR
jgi:hypothetical protein